MKATGKYTDNVVQAHARDILFAELSTLKARDGTVEFRIQPVGGQEDGVPILRVSRVFSDRMEVIVDISGDALLSILKSESSVRRYFVDV